VQASSDHWSTHISYACLLTETELATLDWQALEDPFDGVF